MTHWPPKGFTTSHYHCMKEFSLHMCVSGNKSHSNHRKEESERGQSCLHCSFQSMAGGEMLFSNNMLAFLGQYGETACAGLLAPPTEVSFCSVSTHWMSVMHQAVCWAIEAQGEGSTFTLLKENQSKRTDLFNSVGQRGSSPYLGLPPPSSAEFTNPHREESQTSPQPSFTIFFIPTLQWHNEWRYY